MRSRQSEDFSYSQGAMAEPDGCISPRAPFASAGPGESGSGLLSVVSRSVHPGDETQTENNNFRSSDVGSVVQPGHITVEERLRNALGGPVTLNDPQMAQGQHADCVEEKMPKFPSQGKGKSRSTAGGKARRPRDSNWSDEQKSQLLMGKLRWFSDRLQQALGGDQSADHHFKSWSHQVAGQLSKTHEQCQGQWDNLLKFRNAIRDHERKIEEGASGTQCVSFWVMSECQKDTANQERRERQKDTANQKRRGDKVELLPRVFPRERYELMEFILGIVEGVRRIPSWKKSFQESSGIAETSIPPDSGITESPVVGQVSDGNTSQENTINDNLATTQGNCEGAEDRKLKNDHDLVSIIKAALLPHVSELQSLRVDKQKHRAKLIELEERKLALEEKKVEHLKRINSVSNASSGKVEPSNMRFNFLADEQHVQAYDTMTPSGTCLLHLQNGANANTSADSDGQATRVPGTDPNLELLFANLPDGPFPEQPSIAYTEAMESWQIQSNTSLEAGNQVQFLPTSNDARIQYRQHHAGPSEIQSNTSVESAGNQVQFLPTNNDTRIQYRQHHAGPSEIQSNTSVESAGNQVQFLPTNNETRIQYSQHHAGPSEIQSNTSVESAGNQPTTNDAVQSAELEDFLPAAMLHSSAILQDDDSDVWEFLGYE